MNVKPHGRLGFWPLAALILLAGAGYLLLGRSPFRVARPITSQSATPTPRIYPHPILTEAAALSEALLRFPEGHNPHGQIVRLVSMGTFSNTIRSLSPGWEPHVPIWIVALLGDNLTVDQALDIPVADTAIPQDDDRPAVGAYYVWDANSGKLAAEFALIALDRYAQIAALQNEPLQVTPGTMPPEPSLEPDPIETP